MNVQYSRPLCKSQQLTPLAPVGQTTALCSYTNANWGALSCPYSPHNHPTPQKLYYFLFFVGTRPLASQTTPTPPPHLPCTSLTARALSVRGCSPPLIPPRLCECLSAYLPHVLTSLSLTVSRTHRDTHMLCTCTKHTPTLLPHSLYNVFPHLLCGWS